MGRARSRATMQDVELVDVDGTSAARDGVAPARRHRRAGRPGGGQPTARRWAVVAITVALVAGGAVGAGLAAGGDPARPRTAAGMLRPVDDPPWTRWRAPVTRSEDLLAAEGVLLAASVREGRFRVTAWDVVTGGRRWDQDLGPAAGTRPLTGCLPDPDGTSDVVVCVVEPPVVATDPAHPSTVPFPAPDERWARVSALDAATGAVRSTFTLVGRLAAVERLADDVVVLSIAPDGHPQVARYSAEGGHLRWWYRGAEPLRLRSGIVSGSELRVDDAFVLVQGWSASVLDAEDGSVITTGTPRWYTIGALAQGVFGTWSSGQGGTVRDRSGKELFRSSALFPSFTATDRRPSDVLVLDSGGSVVGRSLPAGDELWRLDTYRAARLRVDGKLVLVGVDGYQVVDVRTGDVLWQTPGQTLMWWAPLTDGRLVLSAGRTGSGASTIEARRLVDGVLEWSLPVPDGVRAVTEVGGHLVLRTRDEILLLQ